MRLIYLMLVLCVFLSSCSMVSSMVRAITFTSSNKPQQLIESSRDYMYKNMLSGVIVRSKESNFEKKERKSTFPEKVGEFFSKMSFLALILFIAACFLLPGFLGWFLGSLFNTSRRALRATVRAIDKCKKTDENIFDALRYEHDRDKDVKKLINKMRAD